MRKLLLFIGLFSFLLSANAQYTANAKKIDSKPNATVSIKGNLSEGNIISDLSWASTSSTACWPATQNKKFNGNHVIYHTNLPKRAKMWLKVIPEDKDADFSIYAYSVGKTNYKLPPSLSSCVSCEAEHKWDRPKRGKTQDHTREIYMNAINNPYNVVIGVVGANGLTAGAFTLEIRIEGGEEEATETQKMLEINPITCPKDELTSVKGDLINGVEVYDLSWAWSSSNACFPETQKKKFTGNHVLYSTEIPEHSKMEITVVPDNPKDDFSIYAYTVGTTNDAVVPNLSSCISCEAEHKWDRQKRGKTQDHTRTIGNIIAINRPYKVVIGVVGANGLKTGGYTLKVDIIPN